MGRSAPAATSPKLQPTDAASGNDDRASNHMMAKKLGKYGGASVNGVSS
jgi:hypothetical protein